MFKRHILLPTSPTDSFFLWGPRQVGKSTLLKMLYPQAHWVDLLKTDVYLKYLREPYLLRQELLARDPQPQLVVIDEVQKVPLLLDEVHWLTENTAIHFCLCGSSARKIRRSHANMLGGRALRYELFGLTASELGSDFDLEKILNQGFIPKHYLSSNYTRLIQSYVNNYLKEEIIEESVVRNLPAFESFLRSAALTDTEFINYSNIASDCGVSSQAVKGYFSILYDTLLARQLPSYTRKSKRKITKSPKFYFFDVGLVNYLAKRGSLTAGNPAYGKAFESWVFHELCAYREYSQKQFDLSYWALTSGAEVDFIIDDLAAAIEVKSSSAIRNRHLKGLRELRKEHPQVEKLFLVSQEEQSRKTDDDILILSYKDFISRLWQDRLI